jgi:glycosyltransferase involved in cell wall biosynthesis
MQNKVSIILPAKNEAAALTGLLPELKLRFPDAEIIVVDDGSSDQTALVCAQHGVTLRPHPYSMGNGAAVKSGARVATGDVLVFMDADGQHQPDDVQRLLDKLAEGYDMVVGARSYASQAGVHRAAANGFYNRLASWMVGQRVMDLTSGFRAVDARKFRRFLYLLPNQFSYPTTITMSFFRAGFLIAYLPIVAPKRIGKSHLQPWRDGMRFLLIIFKIGTLYSPLRIFFPISMSFFATGTGYYLYSYLTTGRFTNMSALLFTTAVIVFLIGLVSEQITSLMHQSSGSDDV